MKKPTLITGATGRHGGTGRFVVETLRQQGLPVRALVRTKDERAEALAALGAEIIVGDLNDRRSLKAAFENVERAYFTYPIAAGAVNAAAHFAAAGREAGLKRVVVMSMGATHPESPSPLGRAQWLAEQIFEWAGFACLHLRIAALFVENLKLLHERDIAEDGVIRNSFGNVALSWITGEDAARLAVAALLHPERFGAESAHTPSGGPQHTHAEIAEALSSRLGREIRHETIPRVEWERRLVALSDGGVINADMATHISTLGAAIRQPLPMNNQFEKATGVRAASVLDAIRDGRAGF